MTDRLLLDRNSGNPRFKLSKPGFDVDTAGALDLLFDVTTGGYAGVYASGTVALASFTSSTATNFYGFPAFQYFDVTFGKTFANLPKYALMFNDPELGTTWYGPQYAPSSGDGITSGCDVFCGGEISTTKLRIILRKLYVGGANYALPAKVGYLVYQN